MSLAIPPDDTGPHFRSKGLSNHKLKHQNKSQKKSFLKLVCFP